MGDAYFGFYLLGDGSSGRPRSADRLDGPAGRSAGFERVRLVATAQPLQASDADGAEADPSTE